MNMKKTISLALVLAMAVSLFALAVSAQAMTDRGEVKSLVVFGDSISTGYGLEGTVYTRASYANLVAQALGLSQGKGYVNYAVDGYTSTYILREVNLRADAVKNADLILLSCGGNDILKHAMSIAISVSGVNTTNLVQVALALLQMPEEQVNAALRSEANETLINNALIAYRSNMEALVAYLRSTAPDAQIVFLTQYNPMSGVPIGTVLDLYAEEVIGRLNAIMKEVAEAGGCEIVDTHEVMVKRGMELSNILASDIHPNAAGHAAMAEMVKKHLGIVAQEPAENTTTLPSVTTTEPQMTTTMPSVTTTVVEMTTTEPAVTTAAPVATTETTTVTTTVAEVATESSEVTEQTSAEVTTSVTETDAPTEEVPQEEEKSSTLILIIGIGLLAVGIAGTAVAIVLRRRG